jgi:hypothetical protein
VILPSQATVRLLDSLLVSVPLNAKNLVVVFILHHFRRGHPGLATPAPLLPATPYGARLNALTVPRCEHHKARGRSHPEAYAVYVEGFRRPRTWQGEPQPKARRPTRWTGERERAEAKHIGTVSLGRR